MLGMLGNKKSKLAATIVAKAKAGGEGEELFKKEGPEMDSSVALEDAASKLVRAVEAKDSKQVAAALKDFFQIVQAEDDTLSPLAEE